MHFVEHLLLDRLQVHGAAGAGHLRDHGVAVGLDLRDREREVPRIGHVLEAGIGEVAAGHLRAALHQVADAVAGTELRVVERVPAELVHHRRHEDRRVGHAAGDDDLRALLQRLDDGLGAEVDLGRDQVLAQRGSRLAVLEDRVGQRQHAVGDQAAVDGGHLHAARRSALAQPVHDALGRAARVDPALVGDDLRAALQARRQHRPHAVVEVGVVAGKGRVAARAHLRRRDRGLGHRLEAQVVEVAALGVEAGRLDAVAPPGGAGADTDHRLHLGLWSPFVVLVMARSRLTSRTRLHKMRPDHKRFEREGEWKCPEVPSGVAACWSRLHWHWWCGRRCPRRPIRSASAGSPRSPDRCRPPRSRRTRACSSRWRRSTPPGASTAARSSWSPTTRRATRPRR